jgi:hypothetical protein
VTEAAEPLLIGTSLLTRIASTGGQTVTLGNLGAGLTAADIPEGGEYPERQLQMGGATVTASVGKSGLAVSITEEMIARSQFDVIGMHLRKAGQALARHKEVKIFNFIRSIGTTIFDNVSGAASLKGVMTGRNLAGSGNGSVTMDDIFDVYAHILMQGFMPNAMLMHPLTWTMFVKDPTLRMFALANGGGTFFATWTGNPNALAPWGGNGLGVSPGQNLVVGPSTASGGGAADGGTASPLTAFSQLMTSAPTLPSYFNAPMAILVSPFVPYDPVKKLTDIYMFDAANLGVLIVEEDVTTEEWTDPARDIRKIKLREKYGIGILNEGHAIGVLKNVHLVPNEIPLPPLATLDVSGTLSNISPTQDVL